MSKQRSTLLLLLAGIVGIAVLAAVGARSENVKRVTTETQQTDQPRASDPVQNIRFTIYDAGILPREIKVEKGLVSIVIEDRTRKSEGVAVEQVLGNGRSAVGRVKRSQDSWRGRDQVRLVPGNYVVFDISNPANQARLVVAP